MSVDFKRIGQTVAYLGFCEGEASAEGARFELPEVPWEYFWFKMGHFLFKIFYVQASAKCPRPRYATDCKICWVLFTLTDGWLTSTLHPTLHDTSTSSMPTIFLGLQQCRCSSIISEEWEVSSYSKISLGTQFPPKLTTGFVYVCYGRSFCCCHCN